ncbi:hypothetical protein BH11PAT3_BH11PAT3_2770 [soil metagenome]
MRKIIISEGEYYHVCSRGVGKQSIFHNQGDYWRFLFLILYFQSSVTFDQLGRVLKEFVQHRMLDKMDTNEIIEKRQVEVVCFCIMPNHFHILLKELKAGGISKYMQRILNSYGKYYNTKYDKSGHVFQGKFRSVHIETNEQLLYLTAYIHKNPNGLSQNTGKEAVYFWSSFQDYIQENRWEKLLNPGIVLEQFKTKKEYGNFVSSSTAKNIGNEIEEIILE